MAGFLIPGAVGQTPWLGDPDDGTQALARLPAPTDPRPCTARGLTGPGASVLSAGDQGAGVRQLQAALARHELAGDLAQDGNFGPQTAAAVRRFQISRALVADGVVGPQTWQALSGAGPSGATVQHLAGAAAAHAFSSSSFPEARGVQVPWMDVARAEMGQSERSGGRVANPRIVTYHASTRRRASSDEVPWCSSFVNWVFAQVGIRGTGGAAAQSWQEWGERCEPCYGAVMLLYNAGAAGSRLSATGHHVAFWVKDDAQALVLLGGNQGDQVRVSAFARSDWAVLGCRWPVGVPRP